MDFNCLTVCFSLSQNHINYLEKPLGNQVYNETWKREIIFQWAASYFGKLRNRKHDYRKHDYTIHLSSALDISNNRWVKYGNENEGNVPDLYKESMHSEGKQVELHNVGLCVNPTLRHIGASLGRGAFDLSSDGIYGGLEVKTCSKAETWVQLITGNFKTLSF